MSPHHTTPLYMLLSFTILAPSNSIASSTSIPASEAVQVLFSLLADDSSSVREASMSSQEHCRTELNSDWRQPAKSLLVAIGSHLPDLMMEDIFLHLSGTNSAVQLWFKSLQNLLLLIPCSSLHVGKVSFPEFWQFMEMYEKCIA